MATRSFPGYLGSLQGFFKAMAVVGGHIGGEDNLGYCQRLVHETVFYYWMDIDKRSIIELLVYLKTHFSFLVFFVLRC